MKHRECETRVLCEMLELFVEICVLGYSLCRRADEMCFAQQTAAAWLDLLTSEMLSFLIMFMTCLWFDSELFVG